MCLAIELLSCLIMAYLFNLNLNDAKYIVNSKRIVTFKKCLTIRFFPTNNNMYWYAR